LSQNWKHEQKTRGQKYGLHQVISECSSMETAKSLVRRLSSLGAAGTQRPPNVLITGETGSGKDVFARAIHYEGPRRSGPFVHVNCGALPESLTESELFGHVKGAFTDARSSKRGLFELADGGTLFLDEIGTMPLGSQAKVLIAIETGRIRPVGGTEEVCVDVHVIAAMNQDPQQLALQGKLREDLYHRLRVMHIELPPLRERGRDLEVLADHFIRGYCRKFAVEAKKLSPAGRSALRRYDWPGNVRELSHCLESAVLLGGDVIGADFIPASSNGRCRMASGSLGACISLDFSRGPIRFEGVERELLTRAMAAANNNISRAAELLDLSRDTLRYRLARHGLDSKGNGAQS
jgi:transcriptional regulator with PAS, ATPase and Fis domain